jgi:hypothetical protein
MANIDLRLVPSEGLRDAHSLLEVFRLVGVEQEVDLLPAADKQGTRDFVWRSSSLDEFAYGCCDF